MADEFLHDRDPITFVAAAEGTKGPSRQVVVIDPRQRGGERSDSPEPPRCVVPPLRVTVRPPRHTRSWHNGPVHSRDGSVSSGGASVPPPAAWRGAANGSAGNEGVVNGSTVNGATFAGEAPQANKFYLSVSETAREEDTVAREKEARRQTLEEGKRKMLATLTQQLQQCLTRLQGQNLDESTREKYQDIIQSLKAQMAKVSSFV